MTPPTATQPTATQPRVEGTHAQSLGFQPQVGFDVGKCVLNGRAQTTLLKLARDPSGRNRLPAPNPGLKPLALCGRAFSTLVADTSLKKVRALCWSSRFSVFPAYQSTLKRELQRCRAIDSIISHPIGYGMLKASTNEKPRTLNQEPRPA